MISLAIIGLFMVIAAIIIDAQPQSSFVAGGIEWKAGGHVIGWVFWIGILLLIFGGGTTTNKVIIKCDHR